VAERAEAPKDPFTAWQEAREAATERWARALAEFVGTETFARSMGAYLDAYLATTGPIQKAFSEYMEATLARLNMPSREEVVSLARRLTNVELRLDDLDARLDRVDQALASLHQKLDTLLLALADRPAPAPDSAAARPTRRRGRATQGTAS
jgi:BMFP domain-containing protein YqiC